MNKQLSCAVHERICLAAIVLILSIIACGCGTKGDKEVSLGVILPLSGDAASYGESSKRGIDLALEVADLDTGQSSLSIKPIFEDSQADPRIGLAAAQKLINSDGVAVIIGALASSVTLAVAPLANEHRVVLLSPASSAPAVSSAGDFVFRVCASDDIEGKALAELAIKDLGSKRAAVVYVNNDYGLGVKDVFLSTYAQHGGEIGSVQSFEQGTSDFRAILSKMRTSAPDVVLVVGYKELGQLLKQSKEMGVRSQFLSTVMFEDPDVLQICGDAADNLIYTARSYDPTDSARATRDFVAEYRDKYGDTPDIFAALAFDAMMIIAHVLETGATSGSEIKNALTNLEIYEGATGTIRFDKDGDVMSTVRYKTVADGQFASYHRRM